MAMKELKDLHPAAAIIMQMIEKFGTKFVLALAAEGGIGYLAYMDKVEGWIAVVVMGFVAIGYFYARRMQEKAGEQTETLTEGAPS